MDNFIFDMFGCLGDELNLHRNCLLDLLYKNHITNNVIIYCYKDRQFLYENIFPNLIVKEECNLENVVEYSLKKFGKYCSVINLYDVLLWPATAWDSCGGYKNLIHVNIEIMKDNVFGYKKTNYYNELNYEEGFKKIVTNINYLSELPTFNKEKYIVFHQRVKEDGMWDQNDINLNEIIKLQDKYNIVIFSQKDYSYLNNEKIYFTNNLKEYASFINNANCISLISVWSGGGQIGSYCNNSKLLMFFDKSQCIMSGEEDPYIKSQNGFDFCHFSNSERKFIREDDINRISDFL